MERTLALICGAGPVPAWMARQARHDGWRVLAFTFAQAEGLAVSADRVVPSRVTELGPVLAAFQREGVEAALFAGKFWMHELLHLDREQVDSAAISFETQAQSRSDAQLSRVVLATLGGLGISILDPRRFMGEWLADAGVLTTRAPAEDEWRDVRAGFRVARVLADHGVGQTVVLRHGVITAAEAAEGTTAAIERGAALAGRGAVIVKAVASDHDYRFDLPAVGPETIEVAAHVGASVLAVQTGRVAVLERTGALAQADAAGLAVVAVDEE